MKRTLFAAIAAVAAWLSLSGAAASGAVDPRILDAACGITDEAGSLGMMAIGRDAAEKPADQVRASEKSKLCRVLATDKVTSHP